VSLKVRNTDQGMASCGEERSFGLVLHEQVSAFSAGLYKVLSMPSVHKKRAKNKQNYLEVMYKQADNQDLWSKVATGKHGSLHS